jgi:hypothetical protein
MPEIALRTRAFRCHVRVVIAYLFSLQLGGAAVFDPETLLMDLASTAFVITYALADRDGVFVRHARDGYQDQCSNEGEGPGEATFHMWFRFLAPTRRAVTAARRGEARKLGAPLPDDAVLGG